MTTPTTLKELIHAQSKLRHGLMTMDEGKAMYHALVADPDAIVTDIFSKTLTELRKMIYVRSGETKDDVARHVFDRAMQGFLISGSFSYDPFSEKWQTALTRAVDAQTQADLDAYVAERIAEEQKLDRSLTDPQDLDEFRTFIDKKGVKELSDAQLDRYDRLVAEQHMAIKARDQSRKDTVQAVAVDTDMQLHETVHSKKGIPLYVVKLADRVERDTYQQLNTAAKRLGGWYSSFRGAGAIPGFQFTNKDNALSFMALRDGDQQRADTTPVKLARVGDRFRDMAERLDDKGDDILTADRKVNTYRRARMAESAEAKAVAMKKEAKMLNQLADAMDEGRLQLLQGIRNRTDLQTLRSILARAHYKRMREENTSSMSNDYVRDFNKDVRYVQRPLPTIWTDHIPRWQADMEKVPGYKRTAKWLGAIYKAVKKEGQDLVYISRTSDIDEARKVAEYLASTGRGYETLGEQIKEYDRIVRMDINSLALLRAALRELNDITGTAQAMDPEQQRELEMRQAEREFIGSKYAGFFPTPTELAQQIVDEADIRPGMRVLEPSAGIGHIADIIRSDYPQAQLDVVEYNYTMRQFLEKKGHNVIGSDIFDLQDPIYDRIVMNPPFEDLADIDHVRHAFTLLRPGGRLVAIMAANKQGDRAKVREFRDFVDGHGTMEQNEPGAFKSAFRPTGVNTITVVLDSPEAAVAAPVVQAEAEPEPLTSKFNVGDTVITPVGTVLTLQFESAPGRWYAKVKDGDSGAFFMEEDLQPYAMPEPQNLAERLAAQYHLAAAREANGARFQNPSGYAKMMRDDYVKFITDLDAELRPMATSAPQQAALESGLDELAKEYLSKEKAVLNASSGVVSVYVAGGSNFNSKQAGRRGATLDRVEDDFIEWRKKQPQKLRDLVHNARTSEQVAQAEAEADTKAQKLEERRIKEAGRADTMKAGDEIGRYIITRVSRDREGYPSSFNAKGKPGTEDPYPDKFDFWRIFKYTSAQQFKNYVDKYRAQEATPDPIAIRARAAATALKLKLKLMQMKY